MPGDKLVFFFPFTIPSALEAFFSISISIPCMKLLNVNMLMELLLAAEPLGLLVALEKHLFSLSFSSHTVTVPDDSARSMGTWEAQKTSTDAWWWHTHTH